MTSRIFDPQSAHAQRQIERIAGWETQRQQRQDRERVRRFDDDPAIGSAASFLVDQKPLEIRTSQDEALRVRQNEGLTQLLFGTQNQANGQANPIFLIGEDIQDIFTFRLKIFGLNGDLYAPAGALQTRTHDAKKKTHLANHDAGLTTISAYGTPAWTADSPTTDDTTNAAWGRWTTSGALGDARGPNGPAVYLSNWEPECFFRIAMGPDISTIRVWIGLFESDPSGSSTPALNFAGFRFVAGTDTEWKAYTGDGANRTSQDSGVVVNANQAYNLRIRLTATEARMIIGWPGVNDGVVNGTFTNIITTTLPGTGAFLRPYVRITNLAASSRWIRFSHFRCETY